MLSLNEELKVGVIEVFIPTGEVIDEIMNEIGEERLK